MSAPRDATAREHIRERHDASLFIEAGAGTGKTTALVDRVVALVAAGAVELRHLAAITFTEAAAAELRDRVRAGLEAAATGGDERYRHRRPIVAAGARSTSSTRPPSPRSTASRRVF